MLPATRPSVVATSHAVKKYAVVAAPRTATTITGSSRDAASATSEPTWSPPEVAATSRSVSGCASAGAESIRLGRV